MKIAFRFPGIFFYTDALPASSGGVANAFVIRIRPKYQEDEGIHQHELYHVRNWYLVTFVSFALLGLGFWAFRPWWIMMALPLPLLVDPILYLIPIFRQWEEIAAYKTQLRYPPASNDTGRYAALYARFIAENYGLGISEGEAFEKLGGGKAG